MASKYQEIITDILAGIEHQKFKRGHKLPSIRKLSQYYHCSKDTVQKALLELTYQNKIYAVEKSGYYILDDKKFRQDQAQLNPEAFHELPYDDFRTCLNESLIGRENYLFNYYHQQEGLEELIDSVQRLLVDYAVYNKKDQIVITAGSQQALFVLSQMNFLNGRQEILLEEPTYHRMRKLVEEQDLPYQTIERTLNGIDLACLEDIFRTGKIKFFYTIPRLHNPLGTSYSLQEKKEIVRLAQRYQVYIVEDDYLADFDTEEKTPLHYLDTEENVIYIKSFTTTLFPALRIGSVVLPHQLVAPFLRYKSLIDYDTNLIMQKALSLYLDNGMFARNTRLLEELVLRHRQEMEAVLEKYPLLLPYKIGKDKLILQATSQQITAQLKHSKLPLDFIPTKNWTYILLPYDSNFEAHVKKLVQLMT